MLAPKRSPDVTPAVTSRRVKHLEVASHHAPAKSPAKELQDGLPATLAQSADQRPSARARVLFLVGVSGSFWLVVAFAAYRLLG